MSLNDDESGKSSSIKPRDVCPRSGEKAHSQNDLRKLAAASSLDTEPMAAGQEAARGGLTRTATLPNLGRRASAIISDFDGLSLSFGGSKGAVCTDSISD